MKQISPITDEAIEALLFSYPIEAWKSQDVIIDSSSNIPYKVLDINNYNTNTELQDHSQTTALQTRLEQYFNDKNIVPMFVRQKTTLKLMIPEYAFNQHILPEIRAYQEKNTGTQRGMSGLSEGGKNQRDPAAALRKKFAKISWKMPVKTSTAGEAIRGNFVCPEQQNERLFSALFSELGIRDWVYWKEEPKGEEVYNIQIKPGILGFVDEQDLATSLNYLSRQLGIEIYGMFNPQENDQAKLSISKNDYDKMIATLSQIEQPILLRTERIEAILKHAFLEQVEEWCHKEGSQGMYQYDMPLKHLRGVVAPSVSEREIPDEQILALAKTVFERETGITSFKCTLEPFENDASPGPINWRKQLRLLVPENEINTLRLKRHLSMANNPALTTVSNVVSLSSFKNQQQSR